MAPTVGPAPVTHPPEEAATAAPLGSLWGPFGVPLGHYCCIVASLRDLHQNSWTFHDQKKLFSLIQGLSWIPAAQVFISYTNFTQFIFIYSYFRKWI